MNEIIIDYEDRDLAEYGLTLLNKNNSEYVIFAHRSDIRLFGSMYVHRVILERKLGRKILFGMVTDHIDRNKWNNCRNNLREIEQSVNIRNSNLCKTNTSGYRGVTKNHLRWKARIRANGNQINLGNYLTKEKAYKAYLDGCIRYNVELPPEAREGENYAENTEESTQNELQSGKDWKTCLD